MLLRRSLKRPQLSGLPDLICRLPFPAGLKMPHDFTPKSNFQEDTIMELKELFGDGALTYDQLAAACKDKGVKFADISGGDYISK